MSQAALAHNADVLFRLGWRYDKDVTPEDALHALHQRIQRRNSLKGGEARLATERLMERPAAVRRSAMFDWWTFHHSGVKTPLNLIRKDPDLSFFAVPRTDCVGDLFLCCDDVPICQVRVFASEEEMRDGFRDFSIRKHAAAYDVYGFLQVRVFTCGTQTLYFSSDAERRQEAAYVWTDAENEVLSDFDAFAAAFLEPSFLRDFVETSMLVRKDTYDSPVLVLRPYQHHASRIMLDLIRQYETSQGKGEVPRGYIWHSTGSGKTITMITTAINILRQTTFEKVVIVVDRLDLDEQTTKVLSSFLGDVKVIRSQSQLRRKLNEKVQGNGLQGRIIVTTIGKMATNARNEEQRGKFVFLFDECHRSQDGKNNTSISASYPHSPVFGVTGTPIHLVGATGGRRTTDSIFRRCLHKYLIKHACRDNNVLPFNIIYKTGVQKGEAAEVFFSDPENIRVIAKQIVADNDTLTQNRKYASIVTFSSVSSIGVFYDALKEEIGRQDSRIRVALSVSSSFQRRDEEGDHDQTDDVLFEDDEEDAEDADLGEDGLAVAPRMNESSASLMSRVVDDYADERQLSREETARLKSADFREYRKDISKRIQSDGDGAVDILLVVGQFITGFDAPRVNTVYVMRRTNMHTLIQTISRSNRPFGEGKTCGNAVFFQESRREVEKALRAYNDEDAGVLNKYVIRPTYRELVETLNADLEKVREHDMVPAWDEGGIAALKEAIANASTGLRMFPTYVEHREGDLVMTPKFARSVLERARQKVREDGQPPREGETVIIDSVNHTQTILFDHVRLTNGQSVVSLKDYSAHLDAIDFSAEKNDPASRRAVSAAMNGLRPRATDEDDDTLMTVREMEAMFAAQVKAARAKMAAHYAGIYEMDPQATQNLIRVVFEDRPLVISLAMMKNAGFETGLKGFFARRQTFEKIRDLVASRFPPIEGVDA